MERLALWKPGVGGNGTVVFGNNANLYNALVMANGGTTLVLGAGITVRGQAGIIGVAAYPWTVRRMSPPINEGTISADVSGGTIVINVQPFSNQGLANSAAGDTVFGGNAWDWRFGNIQSGNGPLGVERGVDQRGPDAGVDGPSKTLTLQGGTILDGTIAPANGGAFIVQSGTLDGVTVNGVLDVGNSANGAYLRVTNGLVLNGTALVGNPTNSNYGAIGFAGNQVLGGNGTVVFGNNANLYNALVMANGGTTLVLGAGITVRGQAGIIGVAAYPWNSPANVALINEGTISADVSGGTIVINAQPFSNQGLANSAAGTLYLAGTLGTGGLGNIQSGNGPLVLSGVLTNVGQTLVLNGPSKTLTLQGGTILDGTIAPANGGAFIVQSGTLDGVTVNGVLDVGNSANGAYLRVTNGLVLNGTALVGNPTNSNYGAIGFAGNQVLAGNGTVVFGNNANLYNALVMANGGTTLVLGAGITVRGRPELSEWRRIRGTSDGANLWLCPPWGVDCDVHRHTGPRLLIASRTCRGGRDHPRSLAASVYTPALRWSLSNRKIMVLVAAGCLALFGLLLPRLGTEFLPALEEGNLWIRATMPPTISLEAGMLTVNRIREIILRHPEVVTVVSQHGRPDNGSDAAGFNNAEFFVPLKPFDEWAPFMTKEKLINELQSEFSREFTGVGFNFSQYIQDNIEEGLSGVKGANSVKIVGRDLAKLEQLGDQVMKEMAKVPGVTDLGIFPVLGQPNLNIKVNRKKAARYGLDAGDINTVVQAALGGTVATTLLKSDRQFSVTVRLAPEYRGNVASVGNIKVGYQTPSGVNAYVPLSQVADISLDTGASYIYHERSERYIPIKFSVRGRDLGGTVAEGQRRIAENVKFPTGYRVVWAGEFEELQQAQYTSHDHRSHQPFIDSCAALRLVQLTPRQLDGARRHSLRGRRRNSGALLNRPGFRHFGGGRVRLVVRRLGDERYLGHDLLQ